MTHRARGRDPRALGHAFDLDGGFPVLRHLAHQRAVGDVDHHHAGHLLTAGFHLSTSGLTTSLYTCSTFTPSNGERDALALAWRQTHLERRRVQGRRRRLANGLQLFIAQRHARIEQLDSETDTYSGRSP